MTEELPYTADRNVQSVKGGKVHHGMPEDIAEAMGREFFPRCRTLDQNRVMTHYRACDLPVDCTTCLTLAARVAARRSARAAAVKITPAQRKVLQDAVDRGYVYSPDNPRAAASRRKLIALGLTELAPHPVPKFAELGNQAEVVTAAGRAALDRPPSIPQVPAGRQAAPKTTDPAKTDRNATAAIAAGDDQDDRPRTAIAVTMVNKSRGHIAGPGWTGVLFYDRVVRHHVAEATDADGVRHITWSAASKETAVSKLARLLEIAGPLTIALELS